MKVEFIASPNWNVRTRDITAIVIHYTASLNIEGTIAWFKDTRSAASAHFVIGRNGRIVRMIADQCAAWHAGRSRLGYETGVNSFSIGIELVGTRTSGFTEPQMAALDELIALLVGRYHISPERIVGHADVAPGRKEDPDGPNRQFDWARVRAIATRIYSAWQNAAGTPADPGTDAASAAPVDSTHDGVPDPSRT